MKDMEFGRSLYTLYHSETRLESDAVLNEPDCSGLTVNELNLLESIKYQTKGSEGPTISAIATALQITRPSTTVAVNKLLKKKMVIKKTSATDARSVRVKLTAKGERAYNAHFTYQRDLTKAAKEYFSKDEYKAVIESIGKLTEFFGSKAAEKNS